MSASSRYIAIAERYEENAATFVDSGNAWSFVALFYSALHWTNAVLSQCGYDPEHKKATHNLRHRIVNECRTGLEDIAWEYRTLKGISEQVRYSGKEFESKFYYKCYDDYFIPIKKHARILLENTSFPDSELQKRVEEHMSVYM